MKYSVLGFNQAKVLETNLDITDLIILQYIEQACASPKMKHILNAEGEPLVWVNHTKFHEDLPILDMAESTLKNRLSNLKKLGYIQSQNITNVNIKGSCTYYGITESTIDLLYSPDEQTGYCEKYVVDEPRTAKSTSNNKLSSNSKLGVLDNKLSNTTAGRRDVHSSKNSLLPGIIETKPKKKNLYSKCQDYIMQYTNNVVLQDALCRFLDLRLEIAKQECKPFYYNMWPSIVTELDALAGSTEEAVKVVNKSIESGWKRFYPLKDYNKSATKSHITEKNVDTIKRSDDELDLADEVY